MKLTWLGHSCFLLEQDGYRIVLDPYTGVEGYPPLQAEAHAVLCSHQHYDHNARECVKLLPWEGDSPFAVRTAAAWHDPQHGALRGENTIHILSAGGVTVAHLGDLGHLLTPEQLAAMGPLDGVLVPVGGVYTVDARSAAEVCRQLDPRWVVPMHYRHAPYGLPNIAPVEDFLACFPPQEVHALEGSSFTPEASTAGVLVPRFV